MKPKFKIVFFGTPEFAKTVLESLAQSHDALMVVTQPDKPKGRSKALLPSPVKEAATHLGIPAYSPQKLSEINSILKEAEADFFVVAAYGRILPKEVIEIPKYNTLNVHASLLPKYRGASPIPAAILSGDKVTGNSIMVITEGLDAGPVLAQSEVKIAPDDTTASLTEKLASDGAILLNKVLEDYFSLVAQEQIESRATYTKQLKKGEAQINWQKSAMEIEREIRAYFPWPTSFFYFGDQKFNLIEAQVSDKTLVPGKVLIENHRLFVGTGDKALEILKIQPAGKNVMTARDFINGYRYLDGKFLH